MNDATTEIMNFDFVVRQSKSLRTPVSKLYPIVMKPEYSATAIKNTHTLNFRKNIVSHASVLRFFPTLSRIFFLFRRGMLKDTLQRWGKRKKKEKKRGKFYPPLLSGP